MSSDRTPEDVIAEGITRPMRDLSLDLYGEECDDAISEIANAALKALRDAGYTLVKDAQVEYRASRADGSDYTHMVASADEASRIARETELDSLAFGAGHRYEGQSRLVGPWVRITEGDNDE